MSLRSHRSSFTHLDKQLPYKASSDAVSRIPDPLHGGQARPRSHMRHARNLWSGVRGNTVPACNEARTEHWNSAIRCTGAERTHRRSPTEGAMVFQNAKMHCKAQQSIETSAETDSDTDTARTHLVDVYSVPLDGLVDHRVFQCTCQFSSRSVSCTAGDGRW